jgi:tetrahydromethanopterin S-methyltransferase subunit B
MKSSSGQPIHNTHLEDLLLRFEKKLDKVEDDASDFKKSVSDRLTPLEEFIAQERVRLEEQKKVAGWLKWFFGIILTAIASYLVVIYSR